MRVALVGVTGAAGYIGGALIPAIARSGHSIRAVDNFTGLANAVRPEWTVQRGDLRDPSVLHRLTDCDVVLHLAAVSGVMACAADPVGAASVNVAATRSLLELCRERAIPLAFASSFAVVGIPERLPITEDTPPRPTHEYARQKAQGEAIVREASGKGTVPFAILRMSNVYGQYSIGERVISKGNVLTVFSNQAKTGRLTVNAPGTQRRDFVHIEDVVSHWAAVVGFLVKPRHGGACSVFNVASGESETIREVAERFASQWARRFPSRAPPTIEVVPNPRGAIELLQPEFAIDRRRTEDALGVRCRWNLDTGIDALLAAGAG